ncbi:UNVERIFIED_CONTAM: hypothetical protein RF648_22250, partial [Kocuria sp. CPCC 205274]
KGTPYDSLLERDLHAGILSCARFHNKEDRVSYSVPHTYEPDFVLDKEGRTYLVEVKGRFRDNTEASKYVHIRSYLPETHELVFLWDRSNVTFPFAKKRKDGTKATHEEWATKHKFRHWNRDTFSLDVL